MKALYGLVVLALALPVSGQYVYGSSRISRDGTNIVITSLSNSYAAALERAYGDSPFDDEAFISWEPVSESWDACPVQHAFRVPIEFGKKMAFYRVRLIDNGLVPTPYNVRIYKNSFGRQVYVDWPLLFQCNDDNVQGFNISRSDNGEPYAKIGSVSGSRPWWSETNLPPGGYGFRIQATVGTNSSFYQISEVHINIP